jgi:hypothetical protein
MASLVDSSDLHEHVVLPGISVVIRKTSMVSSFRNGETDWGAGIASDSVSLDSSTLRFNIEEVWVRFSQPSGVSKALAREADEWAATTVNAAASQWFQPKGVSAAETRGSNRAVSLNERGGALMRKLLLLLLILATPTLGQRVAATGRPFHGQIIVSVRRTPLSNRQAPAA